MSVPTPSRTWILTAVVFLQLAGPCWCEVSTNFRFISYHNPGGLLLDGTRCDPTSACDLELVFCLDTLNGDSNDLDVCPFGKERSRIYIDKNNVTFGVDGGLVHNPIVSNLADAEAGILLKVEVWDIDNKTHSVQVDSMSYMFPVGPDIPSNQTEATPQLQVIAGHNNNRLSVEFSYYCAEHYYLHMDKCGRYCRPRDDQYGHYTCNDKGEITCKPGWVDRHNLCTRVDPDCLNHVCMNGGECINGQGCQCLDGFGGFYCDDIDECKGGLGPCSAVNTIRCENLEGSYICQCGPNFSGKHCEVYNPGQRNQLTTELVPPGGVSPARFDIKKNLGLIIGLVVGFVILMLIVIVVVICLAQQRRKKRPENTPNAETERPTSTTSPGTDPTTNTLEDPDSAVRFSRMAAQTDIGAPSAKALEAGVLSASYKVNDMPSNGVSPSDFYDDKPLVETDGLPRKGGGNQYEYVIEK